MNLWCADLGCACLPVFAGLLVQLKAIPWTQIFRSCFMLLFVSVLAGKLGLLVPGSCHSCHESCDSPSLMSAMMSTTPRPRGTLLHCFFRPLLTRRVCPLLPSSGCGGDPDAVALKCTCCHSLWLLSAGVPWRLAQSPPCVQVPHCGRHCLAGGGHATAVLHQPVGGLRFLFPVHGRALRGRPPPQYVM